MKRLLRLASVQRLLAFTVVAYARLLIATLRLEVENREAIDAGVASPSGAVVLFWHGRISLAAACARLLGGKARRVMISLSRDGDFISIAAERLGVPVIRGSTGKGALVAAKGGGAAFRQAVEFLRAGGAVLLTPDGPRGPARVISPGAARLAATAGASVYLAGLAARPSIRLRSWDGAELPLPFARATLIVEGPLAAPPADEAAEFGTLRADWQRRMDEIQSRAETPRGLGKALPAPGARRALGLRVYAVITAVVSPLMPAVLALRGVAGKEETGRVGERFGRTLRARPDARPIWLHGASVGESLSLLPLVEAIARGAPDRTLLVTSGTPTAARMVEPRLPPGAIHQYAPLDTPAVAGRFLDHWRPEVAIFAESELWPNLLSGAKARGAELLLVSARMSEASYRRWRRAPKTIGAILGDFDLVLARDEEQAGRFRELGAPRVALGDMKFAGDPLGVDQGELDRLRAEIEGRRVVLAASTHAGEEAQVLKAWRAAGAGAGGSDRGVLVIAPRHPRRGPAVCRLAAATGLRSGRRALGASIRALDVYVADTIGELGLFYRLSDLAFVGGSLAPARGGHNPLEAARLGRPFISGPETQNWPIYRELQRLGATRCVRADELGAEFAQALNDPSSATPMARRAQAFVRERDREAQAGIAAVLEILRR